MVLFLIVSLKSIFQLYPGGQFHWWRNPEYLGKCYHTMLYRVHFAISEIIFLEFTALVVIGTNFTGS